MRAIAANVLSLLIVAGLALVAAVGMGRSQFTAPGPEHGETTIVVPRGADVAQVSQLLAEAGVLTEGTFDPAFLFRVSARIARADRAIRFGEYLIPENASMQQVLAALVEGDAVEHRVTVPEGMTSFQVHERLLAQPLLTGELAEVPAEGSILPQTYSFQRGDDRARVLARMQAAQQELLARIWPERAEGLAVSTVEEAIILASIIEREAGTIEEMPTVASVFHNRLRIGMPLQADASVRYGLTLGQSKLGRGLRQSELERETPYNTYLIKGLPPTAIANPGEAALRAALRPADTKYLYFVADGTGGHAFAETLAEHNRNVAVWRRIEAERAAQ